MADDVVRPDEIREVDFRERMRGYHQEDVDAFLERVARGVEVLEPQLLEARARVQEL
jgi:cell division initiation protein